MKLTKLRIENGVLCGDIPDNEWGSEEDWERFETLIVPEGVTEIKAGAFAGHPWLRKVIIPGTVKVIGREAFWACRYLAEVDIGEGVERIGPYQGNIVLLTVRDAGVSVKVQGIHTGKVFAEEAFSFDKTSSVAQQVYAGR